MKTLIIGGGLSGLALAEQLEAQGKAYLLLEARDRMGGRILTQRADAGYYDLGPAWFWPGQPRIAAMATRLGLAVFDQYATGEQTFEDAQGRVQRGFGFASMAGSHRLVGGFQSLVDALGQRLPEERKRLNAKVTHIEAAGKACRIRLSDGEQIDGDHVVLALPPRLAADMRFAPALPKAAMASMSACPTWMAGQAKAIAVYDRPIWRDQNLSGDAMSRRGPLVEVHDASPEHGGPYALFGFIGVPPEMRRNEDQLRQAIYAQLGRLFGPKAAEPRALFLKDWATDPLTATAEDAAPLFNHPRYGLPAPLADIWEGRMIFAGTEVAETFGGYIEGALEAADAAYSRLV